MSNWLTVIALALAATGASHAAVLTNPAVYYGMCDASAAVALGSNLFAVANDEDNAIRIYDSHQGGRPIRSFELSNFLKVDPQKPETDLEGACWLGDKIFWISSQSRNREGKYRASRHYFFATRWSAGPGEPTMLSAGQPYRNLLIDFMREPRLRPFRLDIASTRPPKSKGALNIEGMCPTPQGHLLLGFRNPIPQGRALLLPLLNPEQLLEGKAARFGEPILLDLDDAGIRDIALCADGSYLILAGPYNSDGDTKLYRWAGGKSEPQKIKGAKLKGFNAEAIVVYPSTNVVQLLSDDGTKLIDGLCCKDLAQPAKKQFRSVWVNLTPKTNEFPAGRPKLQSAP